MFPCNARLQMFFLKNQKNYSAFFLPFKKVFAILSIVSRIGVYAKSGKKRANLVLLYKDILWAVEAVSFVMVTSFPVSLCLNRFHRHKIPVIVLFVFICGGFFPIASAIMVKISL